MGSKMEVSEAEIQKVDPQRLRLRLPVEKREQQPPASRVRAVERRGDQFVVAVAEHGVPCRGEVAQRPRSPVGERLLAGGKQSVECLHFVGRTYGGGDAPHGGRMREPQQFVTQPSLQEQIATPFRSIQSP